MQKIKYAIYVVLLLLAFGLFYFQFLGGIWDGGEELVVADSVSSSENSDITAQQDTVPSPVGEGLAPGTAMIRATILSFESTDKGQDRVDVRVNEVLGYGSSTPVLGTGTNLMLNATTFLTKNTKHRNTIEGGTEIKAVISYHEGMAMGDENTTGRWKLRDIKK